ncbi:MAG: hypothetical protein J0H98_10660 [Solirubrobacterales bacterium]|nr:hypothetical protein [Solirubrobacterales bacterium]
MSRDELRGRVLTLLAMEPRSVLRLNEAWTAKAIAWRLGETIPAVNGALLYLRNRGLVGRWVPYENGDPQPFASPRFFATGSGGAAVRVLAASSGNEES